MKRGQTTFATATVMISAAFLSAAEPSRLAEKSPVPVAIASAPKSTVHLTPGFIWAMGFGEEPRIPLIGDVDGDGFADLLAVYPSTGTVYLLRNERGEKLIQNELSVANLGKNCLAAAIGHFSARAGSPTEIVGVQADGSVRVAYDFRTDRYRTHTIAAKLPKFDSRASLAVGDFNGDGYDDVAIVGTEHQLLLLWNEGKPDAPSFVVQTRWISPSPDQLAAGDFDGDGRAELVWMAGRGEVWRATVSKDGLGAPRKIYRGKAEEALVVGHFSQTKSADLLVGATLLPAADASRATRWEELTRPSGAAIVRVGDLNHKGRDDVIRFRRTKEKFVGDDVIAYTSYAESDPDWDQDGLTNEEEKVLGTDPRNRDTDGDGLLDGWEVHGLRGYDLAALGCSPTHKDVICEIQRRDDVKEELVKKQFQKIVAYYAGLPIENPDGKPGLALHPLFREPIPAAEAKGKGWYPLGERYFAREKRGVAHWMVINPGGGGQSSQLGFMGGSGSEQLYHSFIHEFGHQLGLDHTGYWGPAWCPIYPSLMNYAYSYGFDGKPDAVHYSRGTFAKLVLHEENLDERLPFPIQQLHFLQSGPYHYKMKPDGPNATLIDWNWNGIFGERNVRADINYGYSTYGGERLVIDRTVAAPFLLAHRDWLLMFYVKEAALEIPNPLAPAAPPPFPDHPKSGKLLWRALLDKGKGDKGWSRAETAVDLGVTGDPIAVTHHGEMFVFYPTDKGVMVLRGTLVESPVPPSPPGKKSPPKSAPKITWHQQMTLPDSAGMQPSAVSYAGKLFVFLWRDAKTPLQVRALGEREFGPPGELPFASTMPVGATVDTIRDELLLGTGERQPSSQSKASPDNARAKVEVQDPRRASRWQVRRLAWNKEKAQLDEREKIWIGGKSGGEHGNLRPTLIFERTREAGPRGRIHFIAGGTPTEKTPATGYWDAMQIASPNVHGGWLTKHYYDEWTNSRSAPAAAWFDNNIVLASRWEGEGGRFHDNNLYVAYNGLGIDQEPMSDFDDIKFIADYGLPRSILLFQTPTPPATAAAPPKPAATSAEKFSFSDVNGATHQPLDTKKPTVFIFITNDCPVSNSYAPEINRIVADYAPRGVAFYLVHTDPDLKPDAARKHAEEFGYRCSVLLDSQHQLVNLTGATVTPEAALLSADGKLLYRGRIDDWYADLGKRRAQPTARDLREALEAVLNGKPVANATTTAIGCFIPKEK